MRPSRIGYFVVGLFVLAMVSGLVSMLAVLGWKGEDTDSYKTFFHNVAGLKVGTPVYFEGYQAGEVEDIAPEETEKGTEFGVTFSVLADLDIPVDSEVVISQPNLLGGRTLSVIAGNAEDFADPGEVIESGDPTGLAALGGLVSGGEQLILEAHTLIIEATAAMAQINNWVTDDLGRVAEQYAALPTALQAEVTSLVTELRTAVTTANTVVERANLFLSDENAENVADTIANVAELSAELQQTSEELAAVGRDARIVLGQMRELVADNKTDIEGTVVDLRYTMETIASRIDSVTYNLEGTSRNMYEFSRQIRLNPGLLIGGTAQTETAVSGPER